MRVSFRQGLYIYTVASATDWRVIFRLGSIASTSTCDSSVEVIVLELVPSPFSFLCYLRIFSSSQNLFQHFIWWFHSKLMVSGFFSMYELTDPSSMFSYDFLAISACWHLSLAHFDLHSRNFLSLWRVTLQSCSVTPSKCIKHEDIRVL
jgi:hypothetical protein